MQRIYLPNTSFSPTLKITDTAIHHQLTRVLRARVGEKVMFFDGKKSQDHEYEIESITKQELHLKKQHIHEKPLQQQTMILYQAYPHTFSKIEYIVQKCSEIGYQKIIFFPSERSQNIRISPHKKERIQKIMQEAVEQCGGNYVLDIVFEDILHIPNDDTPVLICHPDISQSHKLSDVDIREKTVSVIVGPE